MTESASVTETDTPGETPDTAHSENAPAQDRAGNREARYRVERNEARQERDTLAQRVAQLQTREAERIASRGLSEPADLFTVGGVTLAELVNDDGDVDPEKVNAVVTAILGARPGLGVNAGAYDLTQGHGGPGGKATPTWGSLLTN